MFNYITSNSQNLHIALGFFILVITFIVAYKIFYYSKNYSSVIDYNLFYHIFKNRIKNTKALFLNDDFKNHKITYLIFSFKDNVPIMMVVLNNNFKTLHEVDIRNGTVRVKLFTFTINREKINNSKDLLSYLNNNTSFKIIAHNAI